MAASSNLWEELLQKAAHESKSTDLHLIIVGAHGSGKSTLINRLRTFVESSVESRPPSDSDEDVDEEEEEEDAPAAAGQAVKPAGASSAGAGTAQSSLRYFYFSAGKADDADASRTCVHVWVLSDTSRMYLLKQAVASAARPPFVLLTVDLSNPWTIPSSLDDWQSAISSAFAGKSSAPSVVVVGCKAETTERRPDKSDRAPNSLTDKQQDYLHAFLRTYCVQHGYSLLCASATSGSNCAVLLQHLLFSNDPERCGPAPAVNLKDRVTFFAPAGTDSLKLVDVLLMGSGAGEDVKAACSDGKQVLRLLPPQPATVDLGVGSRDTVTNAPVEEDWMRKLEATYRGRSIAVATESSLDAMLDESNARNVGSAGFLSLPAAGGGKAVDGLPPSRAGSAKTLVGNATALPGSNPKLVAGAASTSGAHGSPSKPLIRTASAAPGTGGLDKDPAKMKEFFQGLMDKSKPPTRKLPPSGAPSASATPVAAPAPAVTPSSAAAAVPNGTPQPEPPSTAST